MTGELENRPRALKRRPWWVFGILILFGIFEKKRDEMLALIGRLRQWEQ